jgi:hypothetical protein
LLVDSGEPAAVELAEVSTAELLRRLNAVTGNGRLTKGSPRNNVYFSLFDL